ncbi:MAG TPA: hypothetical protein VN782_07990 [Usitatibacter sp.]|nr:hypothetical protein [Usitatibacter sp.]
MELDELTIAIVRPLAGTRFEVALPGGREVTLTLDRVEGLEGRVSAGRRDPFSIFFLGPAQPMLAHGTYALRSARIAWPALFIVPIGRDERGIEYQAAFT